MQQKLLCFTQFYFPDFTLYYVFNIVASIYFKLGRISTNFCL